MNPEVKKKWVEALRSGRYPQGRGALHLKGDGYCCLGVLCDLYNPNGWVDNGHAKGMEFMGHIGNPPDSVLDWAGLNRRAPWVKYPTKSGNPKDLVQLNDGGVTFDEIADAIEESL